MTNLKNKVSIATIVFVILFVVIYQLLNFITYVEPLTMAEASTKIQDLYNGKIIEISKKTNGYRIIFELDSRTFEVYVDKENGNISGLTKIKDGIPNDSLGAAPKQETLSTSGQQPQKQTLSPPNITIRTVTESEAARIALKNVGGGVVHDVDLEQIGGISYYIVEIKSGNDNSGDAKVQINAITGELKTIAWDD